MKRNIVIATVAAAALIGGGAATAVATGGSQEESPERSAPTVTEERAQGDDADDRDERESREDRADKDERENREDRTDKDGNTRSIGVTAPKAANAALSSVSGTVTEIELDDDDDGERGLVWEVDVLGKDKKSNGVYTWYDVTVDADSGKVLDVHKDRGDHDDGRSHGQQKVHEKLRGTSVDAAEAAKKAAARGTVTSVDLESARGNAFWEIDVVGKNGTEYEFAVNADSGKLSQESAEQDDDGDDDRDESDHRDDDDDDKDDRDDRSDDDDGDDD